MSLPITHLKWLPSFPFRLSLVEGVFWMSAFLLLVMTVVDASFMSHTEIASDQLLLTKLKAQKVVVAQDSVFSMTTP